MSSAYAPKRLSLRLVHDSVIAVCARAPQVSFGEVMKVCGNDKAFGSWALDKAPELQWSDGHMWTLTMPIPVGQTMKFKVRAQGGLLKVMRAMDRLAQYQDCISSSAATHTR
jgi:hypothetical protein